MNTQTVEMLIRLQNLGFTLDEALKLRRIAMTFHQWDEAECGDSNDKFSRCLERDEETGKPFWCVYWHDENKVRKTPTADREAGAQRRLDKIMSNHQDLVAYHQSDCRGASLYIVRKSDLNGSDIHANYTRGVAVYK